MNKKSISWLRDNSKLRDEVMRSFQSDARLEKEALPDALAADPMLLSEIAKELVCLAVKQDAPEGVVEELISAVRAMTYGATQLAKSAYLTKVLRDLRGLRDASEIEPVLKKALTEASDDVDRTKLRSMLEVVQKSASGISILDDTVLPPDGSGCVPCCFLGCIICTEACVLCCVVGCAVC